MATSMDGRALAAQVRARLRDEVVRLGDVGLATVLVGDDPASEVYIRLKHAAAREVGIRPIDHRLPAEASEAEVRSLVADLNADESVDGVLVQTPLPPQLDEVATTGQVLPSKDVDGFHERNAGALYRGRPTLVPATALGVMALLEEYGITLAGARAVVVGRSDRVGKPVAHLLLHANATVTICHSQTADLRRETLGADVLVVAAGRLRMVTADMVADGAAVVDVGINRTEAGIAGDVDPGVADRASFLTPVPGGVGPMTIAMLLSNTVTAARLRRGLLAFPGP